MWDGINWGLEASTASCILGKPTLELESQAVLLGFEQGAFHPQAWKGAVSCAVGSSSTLSLRYFSIAV